MLNFRFEETIYVETVTGTEEGAVLLVCKSK